jgi:hypothetical protein
LILISSKRIFLEKKILQYMPAILLGFSALFILLFFAVLITCSKDDTSIIYSVKHKGVNKSALRQIFCFDESKTSTLGISSGFTASCFLQARHLRPDEKREGRYLVINQECRFIHFDRPFFCKADSEGFRFSDSEQKIQAEIALDKSGVVARVYGQLENKRVLLDVAKLEYRAQELDPELCAFAKELVGAKLFRADALYDKYAGSIFKEKRGKLRLVVGEKTYYLDPAESYILENKEIIASSEISGRRVLKIHLKLNGAVAIHIFSASGQECKELSKHFEPIKPFFNTTFLKEVQIIESQMAKCRIFSKRVTLKKGDWFFIKSDQSIHPLRSFNEIHDCLATLSPGSLLIIDEIQQTKNHEFVILGHFFDQTRQSMGVIRQVVKGGKTVRNGKL